jgi:KUP system potassium uptake protein
MEQVMDSTQQTTGSRKAFLRLALGALGVVFGDIGTSPLYTIHSTFVDEHVAVTEPNVLGVLSLVFWLLVVIVSLKYVTFIMRADNRGEGGIMALMALAQRGARDSVHLRRWVVIFGLLGAALFYGDGVITPAISVLSAVEGLKVVAPTLEHSIVPVTISILVLLFMVQRRGTGKVGIVFGPIMLIWFAVIGVLGIKEIATQPHVLYALNPFEGLSFFWHNGFHGFLALGGVVLAITGAEALYADMGHFGPKPIRFDWFSLVSFALVLNYFGQGALLLTDPAAIDNPFYRLVPDALQFPMLILACVATIIASQAVITGAFSMTREAIQLGYSPRMEVKHTSRQMHGEIYVPWVNRALFVMVIAAVVGFRSSDNLSAAYGVAVTGTMLITSLLALVVQRRLWGWSRWIVIGLGITGLSIDTTLFSANAIKIAEGGWFPLVLGLFVFVMMTTWRRGRDLVLRELRTSSIALEPFVESITAHPPLRVPGTAIFLTANVYGVPSAMLHNLKHNKVLHERNVLLTVETLDTPTAEYGERTEITALGHDFYRLVVRFGFAEDPDIPKALQRCEAKGLGFEMMDTTFFLSRESIVATDRPGMPLWRDKVFAYLARNASSATAFFRLPGNRLIELGTQVEI